MRKVSLILVTVLIAVVCIVSLKSIAQSQDPQNHTEWVAKSLKEMQTIKVGMTRGDLLEVFREEGGISNRKWRQYAYRECPYIKVAVEFEPVGETVGHEFTQDPKDKIVKISKPFLEWGIID
jgi:hypothetical protein